MIYTYKERQRLFQSLRCETALSYIAALTVLAMLIAHPLLLLALLAAGSLTALSAGIEREWRGYGKFSLLLILLIIAVNSLFVRAGSTVLIESPELPLAGSIRITLESLCYGVGMGLRLLAMLSAFCLLTYAVHPDRILQTFGGGRSRIMLTLCITLRLFPLIIEDFARIREAQRCRGVSLATGNMRQRIRKSLPVFNTVLLSSLERSFQLAEAISARGYGTEKRSCYRRELWRPRDYLVLGIALTGVAGGLILWAGGWAGYSYYPRLQPLGSRDLLMAASAGLLFALPAFLDWGWRNWPSLRSRI